MNRRDAGRLSIAKLHASLTPEQRCANSRRGGLARAKSFDRDHQRYARAHVSAESCARNGRLGGIAYVKKYGRRRLAEQSRIHRLAHPSRLEQTVQLALDLCGYCGQYEREGFIFPNSRCHHVTGDFVFRQKRKIIYADGAEWHRNGGVHRQRRADRDGAYDRYLAGRGWQVQRLSEQTIDGDFAVLVAEIKEFLEATP